MENQLLEYKETQIVQALAVCAQLTDTNLTKAALDVMTEELTAYPLPMVLSALNRCRRELTGRLTLAAVLQRMDCGLPSADEAFGLLAEAAKNEYLTAVVPEIALLAMGQGAQALLDLGDKTGARMAFRGAYERMTEQLRLRGETGRWTVSAGLDKAQMETAIADAVKLGRLSAAQAAALLPSDAVETRFELETGQVLSLENKKKGQQQTAQLMNFLAEMADMKKAAEKQQGKRHEQREAFERRRCEVLERARAYAA